MLRLSQVGDQLEHLGGVHVEGSSEIAETIADPLAERSELLVVGGLHRRFELAHVRGERMEFGVDEPADVLGMIGSVGLPQQQRLGAMV